LTYSRRIALTTALEKGDEDTGAAILNARLAVAANIQLEKRTKKETTRERESKIKRCKSRNHAPERLE